ncbi:MAG: DUF3006 domain-containing protein [Clostridiales bacterium]|nr:DUF3006 domain-containing protein [Clostridiales bacterium]
MGKKGVIDRFEGDWAVVEMDSGEFLDMPKDTLPPNAVEGSVIAVDSKGEITLSPQETQNRRKKVEDLIDKLFKD